MILFCGSYTRLWAHTFLSFHVQSLDLSSNLELSRQLNQMTGLRNNRCLPSRGRPLRCFFTCTLLSNLFWHLLCKKASFCYPGLILRICLWEMEYFLISVNKNVRAISNCSCHGWWACEPWKELRKERILVIWQPSECRHSLCWALRNPECEKTVYSPQIAQVHIKEVIQWA